MNRLIVTDVNIGKNRISYAYAVEGAWRDFFHLDEEFYIEYSEDISEVPESIAIIPLLCNVLPIAWVCDAEICVGDVDRDFYESISDFKQGYIDMYPRISLKGGITAAKVKDNSRSGSDKTAAFFSGGVDSISTLISHLEESPALITLWGSDIAFGDAAGWERVMKHTLSMAEKYSLNHVFIKSCFRRFLNEKFLNNLVRAANDNWWHGFQYGIGIIGHAAPYCYGHNLSIIFLASADSSKQKGKVTRSSDPSIDNKVRFCGTKVIHDGYEFCRQDKIHRISEYVRATGKPISLRVCWESLGGQNCGKCEKCIRTIFALLAEGEDTKKYGFERYDIIVASHMIRHKITMNKVLIEFWKDIQSAFIKNMDIINIDPKIRWILTYNFDNTNRDLEKIARRMYRKCHSFAGRAVRAVFH